MTTMQAPPVGATTPERTPRSAIAVFDYKGLPVQQSLTTDYWHATAVCKKFGKRFFDYHRQDDTKRFLAALSVETGVPVPKLIVMRKGRPSDLQGTWMHKLVAIDLARWLDPDFAVWMTVKVYDLLTKGYAVNDNGPTRPVSPDGVTDNWLDHQTKLNMLLIGQEQTAGSLGQFKVVVDRAFDATTAAYLELSSRVDAIQNNWLESPLDVPISVQPLPPVTQMEMSNKLVRTYCERTLANYRTVWYWIMETMRERGIVNVQAVRDHCYRRNGVRPHAGEAIVAAEKTREFYQTAMELTQRCPYGVPEEFHNVPVGYV